MASSLLLASRLASAADEEIEGEPTAMDLIEKLASLAQRYEELNTMMGRQEVLDDISLLQRYGREHAELEEVVRIYHELIDNDRQIADTQEMFDTSDEPEIRDMAYEEIDRLKQRKEQLLDMLKFRCCRKTPRP